MKSEARLIGFDDGPFTFDDESTPLVGVLCRGGGYVEGVVAGEVTVDGDDATDVVVSLLAETGFAATARAIVFDGGAVGGFNVIDLERVHRELGVPAVALVRDEPDHDAVRAALRKHFDDAAERERLLTAQPLVPVELGGQASFLRHVGGDAAELAELLAVHVVRGRTPEPLRIAHLIATALVERASRGA